MNILEQEHYLGLIYKCKNSREIDAFYSYKNLILPNKIYRYQACTKENLDALKNNYIWLSNADKFNDLHDCKVNIDSDLWVVNNVFRDYNLSQLETKKVLKLISIAKDNLEFETFLNTILSIEYTKINEILNPLKDIDTYKEYYKRFTEYNNPHKDKQAQVKCGITCFSSKNDSILMWAHYADWNKGYCIEYDISEVPKFKHFLYPIMYLSEPIFKPELVDMNATITQTIFATSKFKDWYYENEYRYINKINGKFMMDKPPSCLYLGSCIEKEEEKKLLHIAKIKKIPQVRKIVTIAGKYELSSEIIYEQ